MDYIKVSIAAKEWGISARRARILCAQGKIPGTVRKGNLYMVPSDAQKPRDGRFKCTEGLNKRERSCQNG